MEDDTRVTTQKWYNVNLPKPYVGMNYVIILYTYIGPKFASRAIAYYKQCKITSIKMNRSGKVNEATGRDHATNEDHKLYIKKEKKGNHYWVVETKSGKFYTPEFGKRAKNGVWQYADWLIETTLPINVDINTQKLDGEILFKPSVGTMFGVNYGHYTRTGIVTDIAIKADGTVVKCSAEMHEAWIDKETGKVQKEELNLKRPSLFEGDSAPENDVFDAEPYRWTLTFPEDEPYTIEWCHQGCSQPPR